MGTTKDILARYDVSATAEEIFLAFGKNGIMSSFDIPDPAARQAELVATAADRLRDVSLYPGALDALLSLRRVATLGVVSDSPREIIDQGIAANGLGGTFSTVVARGEAGPIKPHPAGIQLAIERLGAQNDRTLMIGDSDKDVLAARSAHIDSVLFFPPQHEQYYDLATLTALGPTHIIHQFSDLLPIVYASTS
jgi:HAD superfamily hydrolase (TIGR01509 family)